MKSELKSRFNRWPSGQLNPQSAVFFGAVSGGVLFLALLLIPAYLIYTAAPKYNETSVNVLFAVTTAVYAVMFVNAAAKRGLCCESIFWFSYYLFFAAIPWNFYREGIWAWGDISATKLPEIHQTIAVVFVSAVIFKATGIYFSRRASRRSKVTYWVTGSRLGLAIGAQVIVVAAYVGFMGIDAVLYRGGAFVTESEKSSALFALGFGRPFAFIIPVLLWRRHLEVRFHNVIPLILSTFVGVIPNFPPALPRFLVFCYVVILAIVFLPRASRNPFFVVGLLVASLFASAAFETFRTFTSVTDYKAASGVAFDSNYVRAGHFDAFEVLVWGVDAVNQRGVDWGYQLFGSVFFFVPRLFWASKPIGLGGELGITWIGDFGTRNINLSAPLPLEGFYGFHFFGLLIMSVLSGAVAYADYEIAARSKGITTRFLAASALVGMVLYIIRGSLIAAFSSTCGIIVACYAAALLLGVSRGHTSRQLAVNVKRERPRSNR